MDAAECGCHVRGMLLSRGSSVGSEFQRRSQAETVRGSAWALIGQALGGLVERSKAEGGVRRGVAGRAIGLGRD